MADNRLNLTGLTYFYNKLKVLFAKQADLTTLSNRVDEIVAEGGEPNKIDTISVNGTNVPPDAQKNVALTVPSVSANINKNSQTSKATAGINSGKTGGEAVSFELYDSQGEDTMMVVTVFKGSESQDIVLPSSDQLQVTYATKEELADKQDTLVSGTNIKTINSLSLLGSGNLDIKDVYVATYNTTSYADVRAAFDAGKTIVIDFGGHYAVPVRTLSSVAELLFEVMVAASTPTVKTYLLSDEGWLEMSSTALATATAIPDSTSDLTNDGDGTSPFATQEYVGQNGGKIDTISVNGTQQTITNKNVDITVPTKVSDLTNDSDYQTGTQVDEKIGAAVVGALKPKGSIAFADLPPLTASNLNNMYNIADAFVTTADFVEGAGHSYPAGTEVAIINNGTDAAPVYKYSAMVGIIDLSEYWNTTNLTAITTAEIDAMMAS